jgi:predicted phage gp36 major capsid-like protein
MAESDPNESTGSFRTGANDSLLVRTFDAWRAEFRGILEDHRREIHARLEQIEREIEKKSDKEHVDLLVRTIHADLRRHADDIKNLYASMNDKMGTETMWKVVGLVLGLGSLIGALFGFVLRTVAGK